jgi:hypothetical protein
VRSTPEDNFRVITTDPHTHYAYFERFVKRVALGEVKVEGEAS